MNKQINNLKDKILTSIDSGDVKMRPKWHFALRTGLATLGVVIVFLLVLYVSSFIFFILDRNGVWFLPSFGLDAMRSMLGSLPWLLILLAVLFIGILEALVKNFSFGYRRPLVYSAVVVMGIALFGGAAIANTSLHERVASNMMEKIAPAPKNVVVCDVATTTENGFSCKQERKDVEVEVTPETKIKERRSITSGDTVVIYGENDGEGKLKAKGVKNIDDYKKSRKLKDKRDDRHKSGKDR